MNTAPVVAVLGYPIHHSKSPKMHGYWLDQAGVSGYYVPLEIHPDNFEEALKNMPKLGFRGANVTIPHKESIFKYVDEATDIALKAGAITTLFIDLDGKITGTNTDVEGLINNLTEYLVGPLYQYLIFYILSLLSIQRASSLLFLPFCFHMLIYRAA